MDIYMLRKTKMLSKLKTKIIPQLLIIFIRYILGLSFVFASIIKIKGLRFTGSDGINSPINSSWHFFETMYQSGIYWQFLGLGQLVAGGLLLTQRFAKLGAIMFLPIIANVFVITISYDFNGTPIVTGLMLLANIVLIIWDWDTLKVLVNQKQILLPKKRLENDKTWQLIGVLLLIYTTIYRILVNQYDLFIWIGGIAAISLLGTVTMIRKMVKKGNR